MTPKVEKVVESVQLGEGPHWDAETQSLYFVDIIAHYIHRYVPATKKHTKAFIGKNVSIIIPVKGTNDQFVISMGRELVLITWDGESETVLIMEKLYGVEDNTEHVFNDGKCDSTGRLWAGTMGSSASDNKIPPEQGNFYSFQNNEVTRHLSKIGISNGLAFNTDMKKFYYNDSYKGTVDEFDFDIIKGAISNRTPIYTLFKEADVNNLRVLDGMTIDTRGNLWVAVFNEGKILNIDPRNPETVISTIVMPARQVTSVAFGGPRLDELYVTTGRIPVNGVAPRSPADGVVYRVTGLKSTGLPGVRIVL